MGNTFINLIKIKNDDEFKELACRFKLPEDYLAAAFGKVFSKSNYYKKGERHILGSTTIRTICVEFNYTNAALNFELWKLNCRDWLCSHFLINDHTLLFESSAIQEKSGNYTIIFVPFNHEDRISFSYFVPTKTAYRDMINSYYKRMKIQFNLIADKYVKKENNNFATPVTCLFNESTKEMNLLLTKMNELCDKPEDVIPMLRNAWKLKYAYKAYIEEGDEEGVKHLLDILRKGDRRLLLRGF